MSRCLHFYFVLSTTDEQLSKSRDQLKKFTTNSYVKLDQYTDDVQGFFPYVEELRKSIFKFKPEDMKTAKTIFQAMKNTYFATRQHKVVGDITMVSIHIRLTDYKNHLKVRYGMEYNIKTEFLTQALRYCTNKYQVIYNIYFYIIHI